MGPAANNKFLLENCDRESQGMFNFSFYMKEREKIIKREPHLHLMNWSISGGQSLKHPQPFHPTQNIGFSFG